MFSFDVNDIAAGISGGGVVVIVADRTFPRFAGSAPGSTMANTTGSGSGLPSM